MERTIKIGTRKSKLAMWQAKYVESLLNSHGYICEIIGITTLGDKIEKPLYDFGGKGLFTGALEEALLSKTIDIAVHSVKDVSVIENDQLPLKFILKRDYHQDCLVSFKGPIDKLPHGAFIGTTSLRRRVCLKHIRNDLEFVDFRGNLDTRLEKLKKGVVDAIVVSKSGLKRLGLYDSAYCFDLDIVSSAGQGVIGVQTRLDEFDELNFLDDSQTHLCVSIERKFVKALNASCNFPIGAYAYFSENDQFCLKTMYADPKTFKKIDCFKCGLPQQVLKECIEYTKNKLVYI
ncbi:MAG: hydroxymethylbilane synthase [Desulfurella sp.]|jgi:hydroxymethylbilane synthase|uniref:Hydroxymethylbilane synthase n=2 Tax=Desulfurella TaxID=33001 RepID=A0A1G6N0C5_9BACT|nr:MULTISPECIES: hydroxymethylbilane synthase [Desulfurella]PMP88075.1 MAG: hydroxymethylbilane synthase [Desulfurella sp.]SDC60676.1 hydroxymethylbilane synthase [Desulfurella multipotens]HEX13013.1 hydroxymethylbilane synthase [Desulfurella acetivorans]